MSDIPTGHYHSPGRYEIRLKGHLDTRWAAWFDGLTLTHDRDGTTLDTGRQHRYATTRQRRAARDLDKCRCRFPGCNTRATVCDIDHNIPAPRGDTSAKNCCCLCRRQHRLKTFGGWTVQLEPDGSCLWTSPGGRQFVSDPPPQLD